MMTGKVYAQIVTVDDQGKVIVCVKGNEAESLAEAATNLVEAVESAAQLLASLGVIDGRI